MDGPFRSTKQGGLQADVGKIPATVKTLNCKHDQRIADRPTAGIEALPHYHQLLVPAVYTGGMPRYVPYRTHPSKFGAICLNQPEATYLCICTRYFEVCIYEAAAVYLVGGDSVVANTSINM